ncbi:MAG: hypothetical protein JST68_26045 [Bacteroidetes bacterium]|nr:hypothetical protein [Bacteroidota bacterium]
MKSGHLTDIEIQAYVLDEPADRQTIGQHLEECAVCRSREAEYRQLFSDLSVLPGPVSEPGLEEELLRRLSAGRPRRSQDILLPFLTGMLAIAGGTAIYACRWYIRNLFAYLSGGYILPSLAAAVLFLAGSVFFMLKKHRREVDMLNLLIR